MRSRLISIQAGKGESGFTLVELLMVTFLLSILGVSVLQVINQIQASTQTAEFRRSILEENFRAFTSIRQQLIALGSSPLPPIQNSAQSNRPGMAQNFQNRAFGGMNRSFEVSESPEGGTRLRFTTRGSSSASPLNRLMYGDIEVRLYLETIDSISSLVMEHWALSNAQSTANQITEPIRRVRLLDNVVEFSLRSYAFNGWQSTWDNPYAPKPSLIEVTLVRVLENGGRDVFRAVVPLYSGA